MRVLFDTNVLVSALLLPDSTPRQAVDAALEQGELITSAELLVELLDVLSRPRIVSRIGPDLGPEFVDAYKRAAVLVAVHSVIETCRDPKDNAVLAAALDGQAELVVTGDADLLELDPYREIPIKTPAEAIEALSKPAL